MSEPETPATPATVVAFDTDDPARLARAIERALLAYEQSTTLLRTGAEQSIAPQTSDPDVALRFQRLLELGYLIASADGFADAERDSLARVLEAVTGSAIDHRTLDLHFRDLAEGVESLGWPQRLARAAADLRDSTSRNEILQMVAIIAMADGNLSPREHEALIALGSHLRVPTPGVSELIAEAAERVKKELR
jgi:tellurite resistance protein